MFQILQYWVGFLVLAVLRVMVRYTRTETEGINSKPHFVSPGMRMTVASLSIGLCLFLRRAGYRILRRAFLHKKASIRKDEECFTRGG